MFLSLFRKNLKPKKTFGGAKVKNKKKSKGGFLKKMESLRKESVLIFTKREGMVFLKPILIFFK